MTTTKRCNRCRREVPTFRDDRGTLRPVLHDECSGDAVTLVRPFADVAEGETIHAHGVPLVITATAKTTPGGATWMIGTYRGDDVATIGDTAGGLYPFVRRAGDDWTIQRRDDLANVTSYDDGATWHAPR